MSKITENTLIPISLLSVLAGGIFWLSAIYANGNENTKNIDKLFVRQDQVEATIVEQNQKVIEKLSRLEEQMKYLRGVKNESN